MARIASPNPGSVIVLGDSTYSFPPDLGAGINAAFEDVGVLAKVIDDASLDVDISAIIRYFEDARRRIHQLW